MPFPPASLGRVAVLARHTFTQLVRMKVFYFLAIFAVVVIAANFLKLPTHSAPEAAGTEVLYAIKNTSAGCMSLFSLVIAIVATGLLLPKDVEDRTLYTILAKPVPRLDYLLGKLLGVAALIFLSLLLMDLLMTGVLALRTERVVADQLAMATQFGYPDEMKARLEAETRALGPGWDLHGAVFVIFLRSLVLASLALLLSTFSTSTLFTAVVGFVVLFAGFFQADAREFYLSSPGLPGRLGSGAFAILIPDLQIYNVVDAVIEGRPLDPGALLKIVAFTVFHTCVYGFASWLVFARKEF